jgi:anti-sigma factor RsiW
MLAALYIRGEIDDSAAAQSYEEHFMDCDECLHAVELWRALAQGLRAAESIKEQCAVRSPRRDRRRSLRGGQ